MRILRTLQIIICALLFGIVLLAALSPLIYFQDSPLPIRHRITCDTPLSDECPISNLEDVLANPDWKKDQCIHLDGLASYYPLSEKFLLHQGLAPLELDFKNCSSADKNLFQKGLINAEVKGILLVDAKKNPSLLVQSFRQPWPMEIKMLFGWGIVSAPMILLIWTIQGIRGLIRRRAEKRVKSTGSRIKAVFKAHRIGKK